MAIWPRWTWRPAWWTSFSCSSCCCSCSSCRRRSGTDTIETIPIDTIDPPAKRIGLFSTIAVGGCQSILAIRITTSAISLTLKAEVLLASARHVALCIRHSCWFELPHRRIHVTWITLISVAAQKSCKQGGCCGCGAIVVLVDAVFIPANIEWLFFTVASSCLSIPAIVITTTANSITLDSKVLAAYACSVALYIGVLLERALLDVQITRIIIFIAALQPCG
mmetsp:Transcript_49983/g.88857  ORF Transcript_49983/g.88857 Transcript_49983/m.88857 type:complete len:222 (-) Transcript_49983:1235-1900(-)